MESWTNWWCDTNNKKNGNVIIFLQRLMVCLSGYWSFMMTNFVRIKTAISISQNCKVSCSSIYRMQSFLRTKKERKIYPQTHRPPRTYFFQIILTKIMYRQNNKKLIYSTKQAKGSIKFPIKAALSNIIHLYTSVGLQVHLTATIAIVTPILNSRLITNTFSNFGIVMRCLLKKLFQSQTFLAHG